MFKNALVSTSDKTGLVDFLKPLVAEGLRVVSTGGTSAHLRENGIPVIEVAEQTGFPEVMDGRVRTLHPSIHMPLLARKDFPEDFALLKKSGLAPFDLVIVNLYPFEAALKKAVKGDELIEYIDIGGPSLLRAAAKNHSRVTVVCDPSDYAWIAERAAAPDSVTLSLADRKCLAAKVFSHTARYDNLIAHTLDSEKPDHQVLNGELLQELRYGENPQQRAWWFRNPGISSGLQDAEILHGKALSYNNLLDLEAAVRALIEFSEPCVIAVKHCNPCGVGIAGDKSKVQKSAIAVAVERALAADPVSVFGGIIAANREIDLQAASALAKIFLECIVAPSFSAEALVLLQKKKDLRLLRWKNLTQRSDAPEFRTIAGGYLMQTPDRVFTDSGTWDAKWISMPTDPPENVKADLSLAWRVCAHLKSNAIALACDKMTVGLGMGQVNRVDAVEQAIARMQRHHSAVAARTVLASDAFFPFPDSVELIAKAGIRWVIQPGGSIRDEAVIAKANELGVNMVLTKTRHFRH